ncbi:MAG: hypothetical protein KatS3mg002_0937 [Candidatus Woesearchaeota archaeon]|nr:MAG: hypothetical protein KatS3mg002_0937 [Candidatus Woesearchaeota archaeon]
MDEFERYFDMYDESKEKNYGTVTYEPEKNVYVPNIKKVPQINVDGRRKYRKTSSHDPSNNPANTNSNGNGNTLNNYPNNAIFPNNGYYNNGASNNGSSNAGSSNNNSTWYINGQPISDFIKNNIYYNKSNIADPMNYADAVLVAAEVIDKYAKGPLEKIVAGSSVVYLIMKAKKYLYDTFVK